MVGQDAGALEAIYGEEFPVLLRPPGARPTGTTTQGRGTSAAKQVHEISCPTLVIHGAKDAMVAPEHVDFHETIPFASKYIFEDGKHNLHMKYKDQFNALVSEFLLSN